MAGAGGWFVREQEQITAEIGRARKRMLLLSERSATSWTREPPTRQPRLVRRAPISRLRAPGCAGDKADQDPRWRMLTLPAAIVHSMATAGPIQNAPWFDIRHTCGGDQTYAIASRGLRFDWSAVLSDIPRIPDGFEIRVALLGNIRRSPQQRRRSLARSRIHGRDSRICHQARTPDALSNDDLLTYPSLIIFSDF